MKKILLCILSLVILAMTFCGCSQHESNDHNDFDMSKNTNSPVLDGATQYNPKITHLHADWPSYDSIATLVDVADNVFEGKITNIDFDIVDIYTGESAKPEDDVSRLQLYTIYEVDIIDVYKGANADKAYIMVMGGMAGYKENEQCKAMDKFGIFNEDIGISVLDNVDSLKIGDSYLFLTNLNTSKYHTIVNNTQFAYNINNSSQPTAFAYESIKKYVSEIKKNSSDILQD